MDTNKSASLKNAGSWYEHDGYITWEKYWKFYWTGSNLITSLSVKLEKMR